MMRETDLFKVSRHVFLSLLSRPNRSFHESSKSNQLCISTIYPAVDASDEVMLSWRRMKPKSVSKSTTGPDLPKQLVQEIKKQVKSLSQAEAHQAYLHVLRNLECEQAYRDGDLYKDAFTGMELRVLEGLMVKSQFEAQCLEQRFPQLRSR